MRYGLPQTKTNFSALKKIDLFGAITLIAGTRNPHLYIRRWRESGVV